MSNEDVDVIVLDDLSQPEIFVIPDSPLPKRKNLDNQSLGIGTDDNLVINQADFGNCSFNIVQALNLLDRELQSPHIRM